ncbi:MFS transporter, partial [Klebsiella pneumoniae]
LTDQQFMEWGWRVPFIFSAVLVIIGLYVRVSLHETPVFAKVAAAKKQVKIPLGTLLTKHVRVTVLGTFIMLATYTLFYIMTVYSMTFSTGASFSYNVSSILGASVAPYIAAWLQGNYGLAAVGTYLAAMAALTLIALLLTHETRHQSL